MTEQVEKRICIKFCIKLEHSFTESIRMLRRLQLWATEDWQLHHDNTPLHSLCSFTVFGEILHHPVTQFPYSQDLVPCDFWLFPKLKSPLKGKRFQTLYEIQENTMRQLMVIPTKDFAECFE